MEENLLVPDRLPSLAFQGLQSVSPEEDSNAESGCAQSFGGIRPV